MKEINECTTIIIKFDDYGKTSVEQTCTNDGVENTIDDDSIDPVGIIDDFDNKMLTMQKALIGTLEPEEITSPFTSDGNIVPEEIEKDELEDDKTGQQFDDENQDELIVQDEHESIIFSFEKFLEQQRTAKPRPNKETIKKAENLKRSIKLAPTPPVVNPPNMG